MFCATGVRTMAKAVELSLTTPLYATYHYQGMGSAVIGANPSIRNYYYNQVINMHCCRRFLTGYTSPEFSIVGSSYELNPHLEKIKFPMRCAGGHLGFLIRSLINEGYYVVFGGVDDYYMKGKSWYGEKHFDHDGLIVGYDQNDKTYTIYAYDQSWQYRTFRTPQSCFEEARRAMEKETATGFITGIRPRSEKVELNPRTVAQKIREYLDSTFGRFPSDIERVPPEKMPRAYGIVVQDYLRFYLDKLADGSIPYERMDRRVFRQLWEHKAVMLERIRAFESKLALGNELSEKYAPLVKKADDMRMMYALYNKRRRDPILHTISEGVREIRTAETTLLREFAHRVEEAGKW